MANLSVQLTILIKGLKKVETTYWKYEPTHEGTFSVYPEANGDTSSEGEYEIGDTNSIYFGYDGLRHIFYNEEYDDQIEFIYGYVGAQFHRISLQNVQLPISINTTLDTGKSEFILADDLSEKLGDLKYYIPELGNSSDSNIQIRFNNSNIDSNAKEVGPYVWVKYSNQQKPSIGFMTPVDGSSLPASQVRPTVAGSYIENGQNVDVNSFKLFIDGKTIKNGDTGLVWSANAFSYTPQWDLDRTQHIIGVEISDENGNASINSLFFSISNDNTPPQIENCLPDSSQLYRDPLITFSGNFSDMGVGIDLSSFSLKIGNELIIPGSPGLSLNTGGFTYVPSLLFGSGIFSYSIKVADKAGNFNERSINFKVNPFNEKVGDLDVLGLRKVGAATKIDYANVGINNIRDLQSQDPHTLQPTVTQSLQEVIDHVYRSFLVYSEVSFPWPFPPILLEMSIIDLARLDDSTLSKYYINISKLPIIEFRRRLGILLMCMDNSVLATLKLQDFK